MLNTNLLSPATQKIYQSYLMSRAKTANLNTKTETVSHDDTEGFMAAVEDALDALRERRHRADVFASAFTNDQALDELKKGR